MMHARLLAICWRERATASVAAMARPRHPPLGCPLERLAILRRAEQTASNQHDILVQPADGSAARPYAATAANETAARISPDGRWVAYTSDESGRTEVYLDSYPLPGRRVTISSAGGVDPAWRGDGQELY